VKRYYSIRIDTWNAGRAGIDDEMLVGFGATLADLGAEGASASLGGLTGGLGAVFGLVRREGVAADECDEYAEIGREAVRSFMLACDEIGVPFTGIANIEIARERYVELEVQQEAETYAGTAELASFLGVSKQRVSELRRENRLPAPVAELRAGPVWTMSSLRRFVDSWDRTPGRRSRSGKVSSSA
jgi:hypothetical protein